MTAQRSLFTFGGFYVCANFGENRSTIVTVRVLADGHTDTLTDRQTQTDFIIYLMLYAVVMGQIIIYLGLYMFSLLLGAKALYSIACSVIKVFAVVSGANGRGGICRSKPYR